MTDVASVAAGGVAAPVVIPAVEASFPAHAETPASPPEQRRPLTRTGLSNLVAFTRLLGYVRHFHPSDETAHVSWDSFAVEGVRRVEGCEDPTALAKVLNDLFHPIAPAVQITAADSPPTFWVTMVPPENATGLKEVSWQHYGTSQLTGGWIGGDF